MQSGLKLECNSTRSADRLDPDRQTRTVPLIDLDATGPPPDRLRGRTKLLGHRTDRFPLRPAWRSASKNPLADVRGDKPRSGLAHCAESRPEGRCAGHEQGRPGASWGRGQRTVDIFVSTKPIILALAAGPC